MAKITTKYEFDVSEIRQAMVDYVRGKYRMYFEPEEFSFNIRNSSPEVLSKYSTFYGSPALTSASVEF